MTVARGGAERAAAHYRALTLRKTWLILGTTLLLAAAVVVDILTGPTTLAVGDILSALLSPADDSDTNMVIVWSLRLPMALMGLVVGAALGAAGAEAQTILDNPIADPYTLGISSAAGFGAAFSILFGAGIGIDAVYLAPVCAFVCCAAACAMIYGMAKIRRADAETMILAGIAVLFLFHALLSLMQYQASPEALQAMVFWLFGSLARASWPKLAMVAALLALALPILMADSWRLTALRLGEERARGLGINVERLRLRVFACISLLTAVAVCFVGTIGFVGLVAPHLARAMVGEDQRFFLPMSALLGALLLSAASIASKSIVPGSVYPIGVVTALVGVPFFFVLIVRSRRKYW